VLCDLRKNNFSSHNLVPIRSHDEVRIPYDFVLVILYQFLCMCVCMYLYLLPSLQACKRPRSPSTSVPETNASLPEDAVGIMCVACGDPFSGSAPPMLFPCLHTICKLCADAREMAEISGCTVCGIDAGPPIVDEDLQDFCATVEDVGTSARRARNPSEIAFKCRALADTLQRHASNTVDFNREMHGDVVQRVHAYNAQVDSFIACVNEHRYQSVKKFKDQCAVISKAMEADDDAFTVSASQLVSAAVMCETGDERNEPRAVQMAAAFGLLAQKLPVKVCTRLEFDASAAEKALQTATFWKAVKDVRIYVTCVRMYSF